MTTIFLFNQEFKKKVKRRVVLLQCIAVYLSMNHTPGMPLNVEEFSLSLKEKMEVIEKADEV